MSAISNFLSFLRSAIYAIDVRDGIADAIEQCYNDVNNPTLKTEALEAALQTKIDEGEMAALTIGDHTITAEKLAQGVIDNTLATSGAAADAAETGRQIGLIKADLGTLDELIDTATPVASRIIHGAGSGNSTAIHMPGAPYFYNGYDNQETIYLDSIYINITQVGTLSIVKVKKSDVNIGETADTTKFITVATLNIASTGMQLIKLSNQIEITNEYYFGFGNTSDTCLWVYGTDCVDHGFAYVSYKTGQWVNFPDNVTGLGIDVYAVADVTGAQYRNVIKSVLDGKKLSILGDSISTFSGYIPTGNATYYPRGDVTAVTDTWWDKVVKALNLTLDTNNSYSGSKVSGSAASAGCGSRSQALGNPDIIIVYLGINDFNHEVALGDYDGKTAVPSDVTTFTTAYAIMLNKILTAYKTAMVYVCTLIPCEKNLSEGFPEVNEAGNTLTEFNAKIKQLADIFGVEVLDIAKCGLTYHNMEVYNPDELHPSPAGHSLIANYIISKLDNTVSKRY